MKKWLIALLMLIAVFSGLRYYLIIKPVDYPINRDAGWNPGSVLHILPSANHERFLIKVSFLQPVTEAPLLQVGQASTVLGVRTDTEGRFWMFDAPGLSPDTEYTLALKTASGKSVCDPWPLKTFPTPDSDPVCVRLLVYTCLGGHDVHREWMKTGPLPLSVRQRLLNKALSFNPDAVISTGDQIYYDLTFDSPAKVMGGSPRSKYHIGEFNRSKPVLGTENEPVLKRAADPQIACLYGTVLRSYPTFFLLDDHDYFENDTAMEKDGFIIVDVYREKMEVKFYAWRPPDPEEAIEDLRPHYTVRYPVPWNPRVPPGKKG